MSSADAGNVPSSSSVQVLKKQMVRPTNTIYNFAKDEQRVSVWLTHDNSTKIEGNLLGYDEFMNLVLGNAVEVNVKTRENVQLGRILLKSDNVGLIHPIGV